MSARRKGVTHRFLLDLFRGLCALSIILLLGCGEASDISGGTRTSQETSHEAAVLSKGDSEVEAAIGVQKRHTDRLMANPEIVGTAVGLTEDGKPAILVFDKSEPAEAVAGHIEGVPVIVEVVGDLIALKQRSGEGRGRSDEVDPITDGETGPTAWLPRPVPIGVSTGNEGECSAGTIGARVKNAAGNVYALSNNHVYALENNALPGSAILQPGLFDTGCLFDPANIIGTLFAFQPIVFSLNADNTIDAAIASSSTAYLGNATPPDGYGTPLSATVAAAVGQSVQKYGRTTLLTRGGVTGINATVFINYGSAGTARFVNQIIVQSKRRFVGPGDSGSLVVTNPDRNPVGLLFAGNRKGTLAVVNRIDLVLAAFDGVTVDGE